MHKITYALISKTGKRPRNEDSFKIIDTSDANRWMGIIADGMGGHSKGDRASKVVVDAISKYCSEVIAYYPILRKRSRRLVSRHL